MAIFVASLQEFDIDPTGGIVVRSDSSTSLRTMHRTHKEWRIVPDPNNPNSAGHPTIQAYLALEYDSDRPIASMIGSNLLVTQDHPSGDVATTIAWSHQKIHQGDSFWCSRTVILTDGGSDEIRIETPADNPSLHITFSISGTGETDVDLYEETTLAHVGGNVLTPINRNRNSAKTSTGILCHTPSGTGDGDLLGGVIFGVDIGAGNSRQFSGGESGGRSEFILKKDTAYLLRTTSGTDINRITVTLDWYENVYVP